GARQGAARAVGDLQARLQERRVAAGDRGRAGPTLPVRRRALHRDHLRLAGHGPLLLPVSTAARLPGDDGRGGRHRLPGPARQLAGRPGLRRAGPAYSLHEVDGMAASTALRAAEPTDIGRQETMTAIVWRQFRRHPAALIALAVLMIIVALSVLAFLSPYDP